MALNSVKFRIEGDGTSALKALNDVKRGMGDVKNVMAQEISNKIKQVFSIAAIEEMTRRTAEWATNLKNTASRLRMNTTELQAFMAAGRMIGSEDKVEGWLNTMTDAAYEARKGNMDLLKSFGLLKISMKDLESLPPAKLFDKILGNIKGTAGFTGAMDIFGRADAQELEKMNAIMGGMTGEEFGKTKKDQIADEKDLEEARAAWTELQGQLKSIAVKLTPLATLIVNIVDGLITMLKGLLSTIMQGWKGIGLSIGSALGIKGSKEKLEEWAKKNSGTGTALWGGVRNTGADIGNAAKKWVGSDRPFSKVEKPEGIDEETWRNGSLAGEAITTILLGGPKNIYGKGVSSGKVGTMLGGKLGSPFARLGARGLEGLGLGASTAEDLMNLLFKDVTPAGVSPGIKLSELRNPANAGKFGGDLARYGQSRLREMLSKKRLSPERIESLVKDFDPYLQQMGMMIASSPAYGLGAAKADEMKNNLAKADLPFKGRNVLPNLDWGKGGGAGGSGNLNIGGVFGSDVSFKIVQLNTEMLATMQAMLRIMEGSKNPMPLVAPGLH